MRSERAYYIFTGLKALSGAFTMTVYTPYLHELGLTYGELSLVNSFYWLFVLCFELPTGMLADGRGRGWSMMIGALFVGTGGLTYAMANNFALAVISEGLVALGTAFLSGALEAWIVDAPDRETPEKIVFARAAKYAGIVAAIGVVVGAAIADAYGRSYGFVLYGLVALIAAVFARIFMQKSDLEHPLTEWEALRDATKALRASYALRWGVSVKILYGLFQAFNMLWALLLLASFEQWQLGWIWALGVNAMSVLAGWLIDQGRFVRDDRYAVLASMLIAIVPLALFSMGQSWWVWILLVLVHEFGRMAFSPSFSVYVHSRIPSSYRATFGSLASFAGSVGMVGTLLVMYLIFGHEELGPEVIPTLWRWTVVLMLIALAVLYWRRPNGNDTDH